MTCLDSSNVFIASVLWPDSWMCKRRDWSQGSNPLVPSLQGHHWLTVFVFCFLFWNKRRSQLHLDYLSVWVSFSYCLQVLIILTLCACQLHHSRAVCFSSGSWLSFVIFPALTETVSWCPFRDMSTCWLASTPLLTSASHSSKFLRFNHSSPFPLFP